MRGIERTYYNANLTAGKQAFSILEDVDFQNAYSCVILAVSTGKELDQETGYSYFGARYLDHTLTTAWLSVDPMSDKYPSISPYSYCAWNPVKLVDPIGMDTIVSINIDNPLRRMFQLSIVAADLKSDAKYYKDLQSVVESTVSI